ncbi:glycerophosphodiester phosphodiesterase [bacterium]|nr:MAG: glycerophosphodiester phosphodiesterase [bacterium]
MNSFFRFLLISVIVYGCSDSKSTFDIQGHRGTRGLAPENTIPAFKLAVDHGSTTLELDVAVSKDGQLVISHEPWFNPVFTTKPDGTALDSTEEKKYLFYQMNYDEISAFDVGLRTNPKFPEQQSIPSAKPLFKEMVQQIDAYTKKKGLKSVRYNIEIKSSKSWYGELVPQPDEFAKLTIAAIYELGIAKRCNVQSFDLEILRQMRAQDPSIRLDVLNGGGESLESLTEKLGFTPYSWNPYFTNVNDSVLAHAHQLGMTVIPWTVNEKKDMENLLIMGVDGIITDYPNRLSSILSPN